MHVCQEQHDMTIFTVIKFNSKTIIDGRNQLEDYPKPSKQLIQRKYTAKLSSI
jgi:hypothetical protein